MAPPAFSLPWDITDEFEDFAGTPVRLLCEKIRSNFTRNDTLDIHPVKTSIVEAFLTRLHVYVAKHEDFIAWNEVSPSLNFVDAFFSNLTTLSWDDFIALDLFTHFFDEFKDRVNYALAPLEIKLLKRSCGVMAYKLKTKRKRSVNSSNNSPVKAKNCISHSKWKIRVEELNSLLEKVIPSSQKKANVNMEIDSSVPSNSSTSDPSPKLLDNNSSSTQVKLKFSLFFEVSENWYSHVSYLHKIDPDVSTTNKSNFIRVITNSQLHFAEFMDYFSSNNIPVRTMDPVQLRPKKLVIRGLPATTSTQEIHNSLTEKGLDVIKVTPLIHRKTKLPMPLFLVVFRPVTDLESILNSISYINFLKVSLENYKGTPYPQCYRCQGFGHSSVTCKLTPKCYKCTLTHDTGYICTITPDLYKCVNCLGNHTSNYGGCPKHPKNRKTNQTNHKLVKQNIPASTNKTHSKTNNRTYAEVTKLLSPSPCTTKTPTKPTPCTTKTPEHKVTDDHPLPTTESKPTALSSSSSSLAHFSEIYKISLDLAKVFKLTDIISLLRTCSKLTLTEENVFDNAAKIFDSITHLLTSCRKDSSEPI